MSINASENVFSIEGKGLKLDTAEDVQEFVNSIQEIKNLEKAILSGNTFGVEAAQTIAEALKGKKTIRVRSIFKPLSIYLICFFFQNKN